MELNEFAEIVDRMIVEHDYPGFEPRALKLGLPQSVDKSPAKMFSSALGHQNVYVKLAALRWFQERPGVGKSYVKPIAGLLQDEDEFVRIEAVHAIETMAAPPVEQSVKVSKLLADPKVEVRKAAARAVGKIFKKLATKNEEVITSLHAAAQDSDSGVRLKVQKALRLLGEYAS